MARFVKVLIVDDHPIVLSGCRALLAEEGMTMIEARDAASAQEVYAAEHPDVAVVDINLPDISGFELARRLLIRDPEARIVMFSMNDDPMFAAQAIECGAKGYVSKSDDPSTFLAAIRQVGARWTLAADGDGAEDRLPAHWSRRGGGIADAARARGAASACEGQEHVGDRRAD